jgi:acetyl-CoA decarbonylase/synthase, CODH/ACS complex subunit gamma
MALTGLKIQKYLPKTNCKECGSNTCLAFAMKLAAKKADLSACPYASDEAKELLGAASEPPVKPISLGPKGELKLGEETVFYRHEKTFVNQTALAININDSEPPEEIEGALQNVRDYLLERVGEQLTIDMVALTNCEMDPSAFAKLARRAHEVTGRPLVIRSDSTEVLIEAAVAVKGSNSVLASATSESFQQLKTAAMDNGHALAVTAPDLDGMIKLTTDLKTDGFNELLLDFQTHSPAERFQVNAIARRAALRENYKPFGYPSLAFVNGDDNLAITVSAITEISKFGGICVLPSFDPALLVALMTARMNIFTDPQKPIQVEPKIYAIGDPTPESPVFVTTNFSLTFFIISGEIENSGLSAWLVVPECEGMSVLTSWAAGKFSGASIAKFIKESGLEEKVTSRKLIIPGYVAQISGELEEGLPGWSVMVGPQESADLDSFIANLNP